MEINQENIEKVISVLRMGKFNESLLKVQDLSKLAETLIEHYPDLTAEEIGQIYEEQMELANNKDAEKNNQESKVEEGPEIDD